MNNPKFQQGDIVLYQGQEVTIQVSIKNFSNNKISYQLESPSIKVSEEELELVKLVKSNSEDEGLKILLQEYELLFGKNVPANKKKDLEWITAKVEERKEQNAAAEIERQKNLSPYEVLLQLSVDELKALIKVKKMEIDPDDYEDRDELRLAICQELGIEIPSED